METGNLNVKDTLTFDDIKKMLDSNPELKKGVDDLLKGKNTIVDEKTDDTSKALNDLLKEYTNVDIYETVGEIYQFVFEYVGNKRKERALELNEYFNVHAWDLDSARKKKLGRSTFILISLFDVKVQPKLIASVMLALIILTTYKECINKESIVDKPKRETRKKLTKDVNKIEKKDEDKGSVK